MGEKHTYPKVRQWSREYGRPEVDDQRGAQDFMECETAEAVKSLQVELVAMAEGNYDEKLLDDILGKRRKVRYGTYKEWATLMLRWIAAYKV
jgi:hypothetical protein